MFTMNVDSRYLEKVNKGTYTIRIYILSLQPMKELRGANMDIDLLRSKDVSWAQDKCPWNEAEQTSKHKCAVKDISLCPYFKGIKYPDLVCCTYDESHKSIKES